MVIMAKGKKFGEIKGVPLYLIVMLVILVLLGAYALNILLNPKKPATIYPDEQKPQEFAPLKTTLIYSDDCKTCGKYNSFELLLKSNNVAYEIELIEAKTDEGKTLIEKYNIGVLPAMLIDPASVDSEIKVLTQAGENFSLKKILEQNRIRDEYMIVESDLDGKLHTKYYVTNPEKSCVDNPEKADVLFFDDTYCPICIKNWAILRAIYNDFNGLVDLHYGYLPGATNQLVEQYGKANAEAATLNTFCAEEQGKLFEMHDKLIGIYCDKHSDKIANDIELNACHILNKRYGKPLEQNDIDYAVKKVGLDANAMQDCTDNLANKLDEKAEIAKLYGIKHVPTVVLDCKYMVSVENLRETICAENTENEGCAKENPEINKTDKEIMEQSISKPEDGSADKNE